MIVAGPKNRRWLIQCDECADTTQTYRSLPELLTAFEAEKWTLHLGAINDLVHLCPDHTPQPQENTQ